MPDHEATHLLPPHAASIVLARRAVEALPLEPARTGEVKLIVSELVTNSIEHGELGAHDGALLVEEGQHLVLGHLDLVAAAHAPNAT